MSTLRLVLIASASCLALSSAMAQAPPPVPALPDAPRLTSYNLSGTTCACSVNFSLYGDSTDYWDWVEVWINGVNAPYNGPNAWTITSPTGPLATIPRPVNDAVLTFSAPVTGIVEIVGARRPRRAAQFTESRGVPARDLNQVLTDIIAMLREDWDKINDVTGRGLFFAPGTTTGPMPSAAACVNGYLQFDSTGANPTCTPGVATYTATTTEVINNAALVALVVPGVANGTSVTRLGWNAPGDGGQAKYAYSVSPCPSNSGAGNNGSEVPAATGGCWLIAPSQSGTDIRVFGALGNSNGTTGSGFDNTNRIQAAIYWCQASGNKLLIGALPVGLYYRLGAAIQITSGCDLGGTISPYALDYSTNPTPYAGSWLFFDHLDKGIIISDATYTTNPSSVKLHDFGTRRAQPVPGVGWTPIAADFDIFAYGGDGYINRLMLVNATNCIHMEGRFFIQDVEMDCMNKGIVLDSLADTAYINNIHDWDFFSTDSNVIAYRQANHIGMQVGRSDGHFVSNYFSINQKWCIEFSEGTGHTPGVTTRYSMSNVYCDNVSRQGIIYDAGLLFTTDGTISGLHIVNTGGAGTHNIDVETAVGQWLTVNGFRGSGAGNSAISSVAATTGVHSLQLGGVIIDSFSTAASVAPFTLGAATTLSITGAPLIAGSPTGSSLATGAGFYQQSAMLNQNNVIVSPLTYGSPMTPPVYTVAQVGALTCDGSHKGNMVVVGDFTALPTYGSTTLVGGGAISGTVVCDGSAWASH